MSVATPGRAAPAKSRRGRETAFDMIRSLALIMLLVVPIWWLARPPSSDSQAIRPIDPTADITSFRSAVPGVPVPGGLPEQWRATSSTLEPGALRIGWVTPSGEYAEYDASTAPPAQFLPEATGDGREVGTVQVGDVAWRQLSDADGHDSLVLERAGATVVVGGFRETTTLDELRVLAAAVR
jgi:hypothetical protein